MPKRFEVDGVEFAFDGESSPGRFHIAKTGGLLERYRALLKEMSSLNVVELGIFRGGSAALAALEGDPRRLVAVDICEPVEALDQLIDARGWQHVRAYYRVDQSDQATLSDIVAREFGGEPLDLVIDDASHVLEPTRASFEILFPSLRPGGRYLIEDWDCDLLHAAAVESIVRNDTDRARAIIEAAADPRNHGHAPAATVIAREPDPLLQGLAQGLFPSGDPGFRPLASIIAELVAAHSARPDIVASVTVDGPWVTVVRGGGELTAPCSLAQLGGWARHLVL
jgi:predicted O-methyltransferase YrrM